MSDADTGWQHHHTLPLRSGQPRQRTPLECVEQPVANALRPRRPGQPAGAPPRQRLQHAVETIPISDGIEPESSVCWKVSSWTLCRPPSCEGSEPEIWLSARLAMVRLGHAK